MRTALSILSVTLLLALPARGESWSVRCDRVAVESARVDLFFALVRNPTDFWRGWQATDAALVRLFHQDPAFEQAVRFEDPQVTVNAYPWLLDSLLDNAAWLRRLGRPGAAETVLAAAERLAALSRADPGPWSALVLNTLSRFLLAGWRDVDDPLGVLEFQVGQVAVNAERLRQRVRPGGAAPGLPPAGLAAALRVVISGRLGLLPAHLALRVLPAAAPAEYVGVLRPSRPFTHTATTGGHDPLMDDLAFALNLPFGLVPPGKPVIRLLESLPEDLPAGLAVLLGGGDGAEALAAATSGRFAGVVVVEHSRLAVRRNRELAARLTDHLGGTPVQALLVPAQEAELPTDSASVVAAIHLLEYLSASQRRDLYVRIGRWLATGGIFELAVHLAEGPRFEKLRQGFSNVAVETNGAGVRLTFSRMAPSHPDAVQVQRFFRQDALLDELAASFPDGTYALAVLREETPGGFVELTVTLSKR